MKTKKYSASVVVSRLLLFACFIAAFCFLTGPSEARADAKALTLPAAPYRNAVYPSEKANVFYYAAEKEEDGQKTYFIYRVNVSGGEVSLITSIQPDGGYKSLSMYYAADKLYFITDNYYFTGGKEYDYPVNCVDLTNGNVTKLFDITMKDDAPRKIGVDRAGRIYVSTMYNKVLVYHGGSLTASLDEGMDVAEFCGFDSSNGNIYYIGTSNWVYWGYDHDMNALKTGRLSGNSISFSDKAITLLDQAGWYTHYGYVEKLTDRYLAVLTPFGGNTLYVLDSAKISPSDVTDSSTTISLLDSSVSVSGVNLKNKDAVVAVAAKTWDGGRESSDNNTIGTRCAWDPENQAVFVQTQSTVITGYRVSDGSEIGTLNASYPVYKLLNINGVLTAFEKNESGFAVEQFDTGLPEKITVSGKTALGVGKNETYTVETDGQLKVGYTFESSDSSVLGVDSEGNASAWSAGNAVITVKSADGRLTDSIKVTVKESASSKSNGGLVNGQGNKSPDTGSDSYYSWASTIRSYLVKTGAGTLMRVQAKSNKQVLIEYLKADGSVKETKILKNELPLFGGFYAGKNYYFLVFGQKNLKESKSKEVVRAVKYSKKWKRLGACSISDINTVVPFEAGSLRMAQLDSALYIHTCHKMYKSSDGLNHQANMTFVINETDMTLKDSFSDVMNLSTGYVSHSFNQFIRADAGSIYRVDHGDAYPRGIALTVTSKDSKVSEPEVAGSILSISGTVGANYTGVSVGGMEVSSTSVLVAINRDISSSDTRRNINIVSYDKKTGKSEVIKITKYKAKDKTSCGTPKLVKLDRNHFFLLWTETKNSKTGSRCTAMAQIDGQGRRVSKIVRKNLILSDCDPVLMGDGTICWYASENKTMRVFRVNVFHPELAPEMPTEISLVKSMSLKKGSKVSLSPVMKSDFAQSQLTWSSSAPKTVSVTKDGVIRALAAGSAKITVKTDNGLSAVCKVKVTKAESKYTLTKPVITKAKVKGHEITLSWKKLSSKMRKNVSKVEIQISTGSKFTWRIARRTQPSKTQLVLKGLMKKKTYFIRVRYIAKDGSVSAWSRTKKVKTKA